jgi:hypothetical protein
MMGRERLILRNLIEKLRAAGAYLQLFAVQETPSGPKAMRVWLAVGDRLRIWGESADPISRIG